MRVYRFERSLCCHSKRSQETCLLCSALKVDTNATFFVLFQSHEEILRDNLLKKPDMRRDLFLLKIVAFLVPFLIAMKKRAKVPDLTKLLPQLTGVCFLCHRLDVVFSIQMVFSCLM